MDIVACNRHKNSALTGKLITGKCTVCKGMTHSESHKLCEKCSVQLNSCYYCGASPTSEH